MNSVVEVMDGILRVTLALPLGIDHVHCYLLRGGDGAWMLVDTGLGVPDAAADWSSVAAGLDAPVARIVITHFHPDHVGAAALVAEQTGAPVHQGTADYAQCLRTWGPDRSAEPMLAWTASQGLPAADAEFLRAESDSLAQLVRFAPDPVPLEPGERIDGWEVLHLPGHADGHLCLLRDGVLVAGDALLATISPNVGLYPESRPDPLGDYLASLGRIVELAPAVAFAGHGATIGDPAGRAGELQSHHAERLERTLEALGESPRTAYEVSLDLFPEPLPRGLRRFALAEAAAHLEHLALRGAARSLADDGLTTYAA